MVKLKVVLSVLVLVTVFAFPLAKCSPVESETVILHHPHDIASGVIVEDGIVLVEIPLDTTVTTNDAEISPYEKPTDASEENGLIIEIQNNDGKSPDDIKEDDVTFEVDTTVESETPTKVFPRSTNKKPRKGKKATELVETSSEEETEDDGDAMELIKTHIIISKIDDAEARGKKDENNVEVVIPVSRKKSQRKNKKGEVRTEVEETLDLTGLSDEEIMRTIELLGDEEQVVPFKDTISPYASIVGSMFEVSNIDEIITKRNTPNALPVIVTTPKRNTAGATYIPQYSTNELGWIFQPFETYMEPAQPYTYVQPTVSFYKEPITVSVDQSRYRNPYLDHFYKRSAPEQYDIEEPEEVTKRKNYFEMLKIHDTYDTVPSLLDLPIRSSPIPSMRAHAHKRHPSRCQNHYPTRNVHKRSSGSCGCSSCSGSTDSSCSSEIIEKPTFIIEEAPETVEKPSFKVTEKTETVSKPDFVVKEVTEVVAKPNYAVQEKIQTVEKPKFVVEESTERVNKPTFKVEEQPETVIKPEFVIEETKEVIEKPEFTIEENIETVVKPKYQIETKTETVAKPNFVVQEHVHHVQKPEFVVTEKTETVSKPEFKVEEKVEVVKKPKYEIREEVQTISKPSFIVEQTEVIVDKPEFVVTEEILPVKKPNFLIEEKQEIVEKPEFYVTEVIQTVDKPNYLIEETQETVTKPSFNVQDDTQTVKKPQFVVKEQSQTIVKPEFVVEETTIPVKRPEYIIEEVVENVEKPSFLVQATPCYVEKPEYTVHEVVEKVNKPSFKVVEKKETIKKPSFVVEEDVQTVYKPCFNVVTCSGTPRRVPPKFSKGSGSSSKHYYSSKPSYRRKTYKSQNYRTSRSSTEPNQHYHSY